MRVKSFPDFQAGDVIRVHTKIKEGNKERLQIFEGLIIAIKGGQSSSPMLTVRKVSHGVGVEIIIPMFGPNINKIELVKRAKVRRAKLYYVRDLTAKQSRMKYKAIKEFMKEEPAEEAKAEEVMAEAPSEEKKETKPEEKSE